MSQLKLSENVVSGEPQYLANIKNFLANYEDGWDIFINAYKRQEWDLIPRKMPEAEGKDLPDTWLGVVDHVISIIAHEKYGLDTFPNKIEMINADFMMNAYSRGGMPIYYDHWSFGMEREQQEKLYRSGKSGLAYEIVINTNPVIAYCMRENDPMMQMLVIAHASYGHNNFFKCNELFKQFTSPETIIGHLERLKDFVLECEDKYGMEEVSHFLDACHALESHGVNRYTKPRKRSPEEMEKRRLQMEEERIRSYDAVMEKTGSGLRTKEDFKQASNDPGIIPADLEENILMYIAEYAPHLETWQRQLLKMKSELAQHFYPNRQTKVMNEGWASYWHYTIMTDLNDLGLIDGGMFLSFLNSHCGVAFQPDHDSRYFGGSFNPYALGIAIYNDIQRMCQNPTDEDRKWFPHLAGKEDWLSELKFAMENFKDESFILQYLSPKVIRDFKLFSVRDDDQDDHLEITAIHNDEGYRQIREDLASLFNLGDQQPRIEVAGYNYKENRELTLKHTVYNRRPLEQKDANEVLKYLHQLWKQPVTLKSVDLDGNLISEISCPPKMKTADLAPVP